MMDNNDPQELGEAIRTIMQKYGKTACEASDWLYAQMATTGAPLPVLVQSMNLAAEAVLTLSPATNGPPPTNPPQA